MIKPILEYASAIWSPYTQKNIDLLEAVQRQSVRFILFYFKNNYLPYASVSEMLNKPDFKTLTERRNESKSIFSLQVLNNLVDIDTSSILFPDQLCIILEDIN